jgi:hypothetical protein
MITMPKLATAACVLLLSICNSQASAAEQERNAESFEKLRAECVKFVPRGWIVELTLANDGNSARAGECPALVIRTERSVPVEYHMPNPSTAGETFRKTEPLAIRLVAQPYVSPIDYAAMKRRNNDFTAQRTAMAKRMKSEKINSAFMGPEPIPPSGFRPESYTETRLVWEYAFLWLETEPKPLPTHRFEILTLKLDAPQNVTINDKRAAEDFQAILQSIGKTLAAYESAGARVDAKP